MGRLADGHPMQKEETTVKGLSHIIKKLYLGMCSSWTGDGGRKSDARMQRENGDVRGKDA